MSDASNIIHPVESDNPQASAAFLPLVYNDLRKIADRLLSHENPGQTLQPTALVHEAFLRLAEGERAPHWNDRNHFFAVAVQTMRHILTENARRKGRQKRGGQAKREALDESNLMAPEVSDSLVNLEEALLQLAAENPQAAELVNLRYFAGMTIPQAAAVLGVSPRTADFLWSRARAWLLRKIEGEQRETANDNSLNKS